MTDKKLIPNEVCAVMVFRYTDGSCHMYLFGIYETEEIAKKRVADHINLGILSETDTVHYSNQIVWGEEDD